MKFIKIPALTCCLILAFSEFASSSQIQYLFPKDKSSWIQPESPLIVRFENITPNQIDNRQQCIRVRSEKSGFVRGRTIVSSDEKTLIFYPERPYLPADKISARLSPRLVGRSEAFLDTTISFSIAPIVDLKADDASHAIEESLPKQTSAPKYTPNQDGVVVLNGVSVPSDFPYIDITINDNPDSGYIFCNYEGDRYFNLILDNSGAPVFYWIVPDSRRDFKVQETGVLTMTVREGFGGGGYIAVDNTYTVVDTFFAPPGYRIDEHELLVLANGHYLITAMDTKIIDMSKIVPGGHPSARVTGYHLIEMDARDNPVFIWRCWDHYDITDAEYVDLTQRNIDYLHTNSIAVDLDGHYLITPKLLNEITKINSKTGDIIWRLGGKQNEFEYINFDDFIYMQHAVRVLPNGNYTVFDNGNYHNPHYSRALEFKVDAEQKTVTKIWEFRDSPDKQSYYKGNVQRLPNGNTLINWGMQDLPKLTEVRPDGSKAFEMNFENPVQCYRVFRFPWQANAAAPFLVVEKQTDKVVLLFNKFGDPDVQEYHIYGGPAERPTQLMHRTSEPYYILDENDFVESEIYYFRVTAMDSHGNESAFSNEERVRTQFIPANKNLISNSEFTYGSTKWDFFVSDVASAQLITDNDQCRIAISNGGAGLSHVRVSQDDLTLYQGQTYSFEFDARADKARAIDARIESSSPPYTNYGKIGLTLLKSEMNRFVYTFTMENSTTEQARLVFHVGQDQNDIYLDNVVLKRLSPTNIAKNRSPSEPLGFVLHPVYPNPFNASAKISFTVPVESLVSIEIIDVLGRLVHAFPEEHFAPGHHTRHITGELLSSGIYFCTLHASDRKTGTYLQKVRRMVFLK